MQKISSLRSLLAEVVFFLHIPIGAPITVLLLIPSSVMPNRIEVHFWYVVVMFVLLFVWGMIWTVKFRDRIYAVCFLTTLAQWLRGYDLWDKQNYDYSFVSEAISRSGIRIFSEKTLDRLTYFQIALGVLFFVLKTQFGIVLY